MLAELKERDGNATDGGTVVCPPRGPATDAPARRVTRGDCWRLPRPRSHLDFLLSPSPLFTPSCTRTPSLRHHVRQLRVWVYLTGVARNASPFQELNDALYRIFEHFPNIRNIQVVVITKRSISHPTLRMCMKKATIDVPYPQDITLHLKAWTAPVKFESPEHFYRLLQVHPKLSRITIWNEVQFTDSDEHNWFSDHAPSRRTLAPALRTVNLFSGQIRDRDRFLLWLCRNGEYSSLSKLDLLGKCTAGMNQALADLGSSLESLTLRGLMNFECAWSLLRLGICLTRGIHFQLRRFCSNYIHVIPCEHFGSSRTTWVGSCCLCVAQLFRIYRKSRYPSTSPPQQTSILCIRIR